MGAKHSLEDLRRHGRDLHQPYAAEVAHNRELKDQQAQADRQASAAANSLATDEAAFADLAYMARLSGDKGTYEKQKAKLDKLTAEKYEAARYAEWLTQQVRESDARLAELEAAATDYVCREIARPESEAAAKAIDDALEALVTALAREEEVRDVTAAAIRVRGRAGSAERMGRHLRALTLAAVGDLGDLRHAVESWRKEAYRGGYKGCRQPRNLPR